MQINHFALRAAQVKAAIAEFLADEAMWKSANEQMRAAVNMPWYRRMQ